MKRGLKKSAALNAGRLTELPAAAPVATVATVTLSPQQAAILEPAAAGLGCTVGELLLAFAARGLEVPAVTMEPEFEAQAWLWRTCHAAQVNIDDTWRDAGFGPAEPAESEVAS